MSYNPEQEIQDLYRRIDEAVKVLTKLHAGRLHCAPGCSSCCVDDITVYSVEAMNIRTHHPALLDDGTPHAAGACAFLDTRGECRIYADRPYVCRTQGLPIRWMDEDDEGNVIELRDICPLNERGTPVEELQEEACWTIGPFEERLSAIQSQAGNGVMTRVALRGLFREK
jgi:Fe-S-cluster containining protein